MQFPTYNTPLLNAELEALLLKENNRVYSEDEFADFMSKAVFLKSALAGFLRHIEYATSSLYNEKPREIRFGFINDSRLNAFAYASPDDDEHPFDFIGINLGGLLTLFDLFLRIMSHPQNFEDVGNPSAESAARLEGTDLHLDFASAIANGHSSTFPQCPIRTNFAQLLTLTALDFLFFHEIGHLRNGHLEYFRNHLKLNFLPAAFTNVIGNSRQDILQALEMDADSFATFHTLRHACGNHFGTFESTETALTEAYSSSYGSVKKSVRTALFSIYMFFRIFDEGWRFDSQPKHDHPMAAMRMSWGPIIIQRIFNVQSTSKFWPPEVLEYFYSSFKDDSREIITSAELSFALIKNESPDFGMIMSTYGSPTIAGDYVRKLADTWTSIRPDLNKYKRGGVLAP